MTTVPPDEIRTADAARLLGISDEMLRRVAAAGYVTRHARGRTTVSGAVQGYARFLKDDGARGEANAAQARAHRAKAAKITAATARRRASLMARADAEQVIILTAEEAISRLRAIDLTGLIDGATVKSFASEVEVAVGRIEVARAAALAALRGEAVEVDDDD